jgi:hypothetical protein
VQVLQKFHRGHPYRRRYMATRRSVLVCTSLGRGYIGRRKAWRRRRHVAARQLQALCRMDADWRRGQFLKAIVKPHRVRAAASRFIQRNYRQVTLASMAPVHALRAARARCDGEAGPEAGAAGR